jgi:hypothetical protein
MIDPDKWTPAMAAILKRWDPGACVLLVPSQLHKSYRPNVAMGEVSPYAEVKS